MPIVGFQVASHEVESFVGYGACFFRGGQVGSHSVAHALQAQLLKGFVHAFELSDGVGQIECGNLSSKFLNVVQQSVDVCRFGVIGFALNASIVLQGVVDLFGIFFLGFHG